MKGNIGKVLGVYQRARKSERRNFLSIYNRAWQIRKNAELYYDSMVRHCAKLSRHDHSFAFIVHRVGAFGGPDIDQIERPKTVELTETDNCVVIKDGLVYELKREIR